MIRTMTTATNTMNQLQQRLDLIGNNLSNVGTHGYKSSAATFQELLFQQMNNDKADQAERSSDFGIRMGTGAHLGSLQMNWKVGSVQITDRQLDFALTEPKQHFNLIQPTDGGEEIIYSRKGNFYLSPTANGDNALVNEEGLAVADSAGRPIVFSGQATDYQIRPNGVLQVTTPQGTQEFNLGVTVLEKPDSMVQLSATSFGLPTDLAALGLTANDLLTEMTGAGRDQIGLQNQALETSNVEYEKEMADMISTQRAYQFNARSVTMADQMMGLINGIR
ncbi:MULTISPECIES: flagellar hook-basal body protein [unclassified Sporosarcina]|uniref:flagellar hook-basal body protein n=1 Tax=unclassified Sporosarcina TaxID=2647733 RepID=UPI000C1639A7|nr:MULTISPECIES: flagellar hook-basal body protein [unclassified Sporosarcina]PIC99860.1 flagellar hook-basal body protein [Sporosarcina sp. P29]PID04450.1 flagellar hook-basal body protein [Sporosarcina sp. P30]PID07633.1 flagellar hook-basal body protein [Sporosarcina sp. P31]PID12302.1 flagellar hook-basal body protein [Sporosarcina sp. P32b]